MKVILGVLHYVVEFFTREFLNVPQISCQFYSKIMIHTSKLVDIPFIPKINRAKLIEKHGSIV